MRGEGHDLFTAKGPSGNKVYILLLACGPQPGGARRRAGICGVAAPRRCHHIACVAAPCICPPGARAKMHTLFPDGPLEPATMKGTLMLNATVGRLWQL